LFFWFRSDAEVSKRAAHNFGDFKFGEIFAVSPSRHAKTENLRSLFRSSISKFTRPLQGSSRGAAKGVRIANPSADFAPFKGKDWLKKPIKVHLEAGKSYKWCSCGLGIEQVPRAGWGNCGALQTTKIAPNKSGIGTSIPILKRILFHLNFAVDFPGRKNASWCFH
jgi:hypothetical protein